MTEKSYGLIAGSVNVNQPGARRGWGSFWAGFWLVTDVLPTPFLVSKIINEPQMTPTEKLTYTAATLIKTGAVLYFCMKYLQRPEIKG